jgi:hypothetical protein
VRPRASKVVGCHLLMRRLRTSHARLQPPTVAVKNSRAEISHHSPPPSASDRADATRARRSSDPRRRSATERDLHRRPDDLARVGVSGDPTARRSAPGLGGKGSPTGGRGGESARTTGDEHAPKLSGPPIVIRAGRSSSQAGLALRRKEMKSGV